MVIDVYYEQCGVGVLRGAPKWRPLVRTQHVNRTASRHRTTAAFTVQTVI